MLNAHEPVGEYQLLTQLRRATVEARPCPCSDVEEPGVAYIFWEKHLRRCIRNERFEAGLHAITIAALGEDAFVGTDRIPKAYGEGLPTELKCRPQGIMNLIHLLYYEMNTRKLFEHPFFSRRRNPMDMWCEFITSGQQVATIMFRQHDFRHASAAYLVLQIAEWVHNYRRLAIRAV